MTKVKLTKIGEVWCSAGKPYCGECSSECGNYYFVDCEYVSKEFEVCRHLRSDGCLSICTNKDSVFCGFGCGYDVADMQSCPKYVRSED